MHRLCSLACVLCLAAPGSGDSLHTPSADSMIALPPPRCTGPLSLEAAIAQRRSVRDFDPAPLPDGDLGQLLWAAQGVTDRARSLRAAPSAGATYPLDTYVATANGLFRYHPARHGLEPRADRDLRPALAEAALGQACVGTAGAVILLAAIPARTTRRYGPRGRMYCHMEAGHAAQNIHLQATALGLGSVPVGAFDEDAVRRVLDLPDEAVPLYLIPVGRPRASPPPDAGTTQPARR